MKNIVIGHCYTTENKGDAAIILATVEHLKRANPDCKLTGVSTFSQSDAAYREHHEALTEAGLPIMPALLPEDKIHLFGRVLEGANAKAASFLFRTSVLLVTLLLRGMGYRGHGQLQRTLDAIEGSDLFVSKGGSFLYSLGGIRGDVSLFKLLVPFWIASRSGTRTIILAQSLGPFNTKFSEWMMRYTLRYIDRVYLRERVCMRYLRFLTAAELSKIADCPDLAFSLVSEGYDPLDIDYSGSPVGLTIVNHQFKHGDARARYIDAIIESVSNLANRWPDAKFYVFPQVLSRHVDGSVDLQFARFIAQECASRTGITLQVLAGDHDPRVLQQSYARMRCFLATRLHSAIFAASVGVPTIVFGYHGSKAEGIWEDLGFPELFFDIERISLPDLERALELVASSNDLVKFKLHQSCSVIQSKIETVIESEVGLVSL